MKLSEDLKLRGLIQDSTQDIEKALDEEKPVFYLGADPTADSLHLGHLLGYMTARRLSDAGLKPILIVGGGTGRIGDPKPDSERTLLDDETIEKNISAIKAQVEQLLNRNDLIVVNNYDWLKELKLIDFLRDIGKNFTVNNLIKKDAIAERLKSDTGLSYTEFAYPLLQATDYLELYRRYDCRMQIGGSDQWGNIVSGVDLIRRKENAEVHAFTFPLLVDKASGRKFGKSEGNALWLDGNKTTPYQMYQFLLNVSDESVEDLLKKLTLLTLDEIEEIIRVWKQEPHKRLAQKTLAFEVVRYIHGADAANSAKEVSEILFGGEIGSLTQATREMLINEAPSFLFSDIEFTSLEDLLVDTKLAASKREAREFIQSGAVRIFNTKANEKQVISNTDFQDGILIIRRGKKNLVVLYK